MNRVHEALNRLSAIECEDISTKQMIEDFSSSYLEALENDCEHNPSVDAIEISAEFLNVIHSSLIDGSHLKQNLSSDDTKALILNLILRSNCNPCRCQTGNIAAEKISPLLDKLLPTF